MRHFISGLGLGLGLEAFGLGLGLETPGLVNIPGRDSPRSALLSKGVCLSVCLSVRHTPVLCLNG